MQYVEAGLFFIVLGFAIFFTLFAIKGQHLSELGSNSGFAVQRASTDIGVGPTQQVTSSLLSISFAKFVRINTLG